MLAGGLDVHDVHAGEGLSTMNIGVGKLRSRLFFLAGPSRNKEDSEGFAEVGIN